MGLANPPRAPALAAPEDEIAVVAPAAGMVAAPIQLGAAATRPPLG